MCCHGHGRVRTVPLRGIDPAWQAPSTYAFALALGADVPAAAAAAEAWAAGHAETSATAFCGVCGRVCWLSRRADAQAALLAHAAVLRGVRALRRQAGLTPVAVQTGDVHPELPALAARTEAEVEAETAEAEAAAAEAAAAEAVAAEGWLAAGPWGTDVAPKQKQKRSRKRRRVRGQAPTESSTAAQPAPPDAAPPPLTDTHDAPLFDFDWAS